MKKTYDEQSKKLETRLNELTSQLATAYAGIQAANNKAAEQTTVSELCQCTVIGLGTYSTFVELSGCGNLTFFNKLKEFLSRNCHAGRSD